jgi:membrane protease YdiL (CAAX protease family)
VQPPIGPLPVGAVPEPEPSPDVPWRLRDIVLSVLVGIVGGLPLGTIAMLATGADPDHVRTIDILVFSTVAYVWIIASFWLFAFRRRHASLRLLFPRRLSIGNIAILLPIAFAAILLSGTITQVVVDLTGAHDPPRDQLLGEGENINAINWLFLIWEACILAPAAEEFVFRGVVFGFLRKRWPWLAAAAVPAALFALAHPIPVMWPAFFSLGLILAGVRERLNTLLAPIILHGLYNGIVLIALYVFTRTNF